MLAGYVIQSYRTVVPAFDSLAGASWFAWSADHIPLAGSSDWFAVACIALVSAILFALGIQAFARRDIGVTISVPAPRLPRALLGVRGPLGRSFGDFLPTALAWGIGLGVYGVVMAASSRAVTDAFASSPGLVEVVHDPDAAPVVAAAAGFDNNRPAVRIRERLNILEAHDRRERRCRVAGIAECAAGVQLVLGKPLGGW